MLEGKAANRPEFSLAQGFHLAGKIRDSVLKSTTKAILVLVILRGLQLELLAQIVDFLLQAKRHTRRPWRSSVGASRYRLFASTSRSRAVVTSSNCCSNSSKSTRRFCSSFSCRNRTSRSDLNSSSMSRRRVYEARPRGRSRQRAHLRLVWLRSSLLV